MCLTAGSGIGPSISSLKVKKIAGSHLALAFCIYLHLNSDFLERIYWIYVRTCVGVGAGAGACVSIHLCLFPCCSAHSRQQLPGLRGGAAPQRQRHQAHRRHQETEPVARLRQSGQLLEGKRP